MLARAIPKANATYAKRCMAMMAPQLEFPHTKSAEYKPMTPILSQETFNGSKYISREVNLPVVDLTMSIIGGSSRENLVEQGAANYLSIASLAGTGLRTPLGLQRDMQQNCFHYDSTADREQVTYSITTTTDQAELAMNTLAEIVFSAPANSYAHADNLKKVALVNGKNVNSQQITLELLHEAAYGETSGFGKSMYSRDVASLQFDDVNAYRNRVYNLNNLVIAGNGISMDNLKSLGDSAVKQFASSSSDSDAWTPSSYAGGEVRVRSNLDGEIESYASFGFNMPAGKQGQAYNVLTHLLNDALSQNGVCATAFSSPLSSGGLVGVHTCGDTSSITKAIEAASNTLKNIAQSAPSDVNPFCKSVTLDGFIALDNNGPAATRVMLAAGRHGVDAKTYSDARGVSAADVSAAAQALLKSQPSYAVYGTTAGAPSYSQVCSMLK